MLLSLGFMPIITKPTRITDHTATLIDHIYTNTPEKLIKSGICLADISDHLPVFCTMANTLSTSNKPIFFRHFMHFNEHAFCQDLHAVDFKRQVTYDVNKTWNRLLTICAPSRILMLVGARHKKDKRNISKGHGLVKPFCIQQSISTS